MRDDSNRRDPARRFSTWFGLLAPMAAWAVHGLSSFVLSRQACQAGREDLARGLLIALSAAALIVAVAGVVVAFRTWRRIADGQRVSRTDARSRDEMLAFGGVFVGFSFVVGLLWGGLPPLVIADVCEALR